MENESLPELLTSLGLTEKEVDTYLTIVDNGETTISTVAEEAGVSKRHVYNTAVSLENRNLVEMIDFATPTRLRPVPPEQVREQQAAVVNSLHGLLSERYNQNDTSFDSIELLKSKATLIKRLQQLIDQSDNCVTLIVPPSLLLDLEENLSNAVKRDVFVLLIISGESARALSEYDFRIEEIAHAVRVRWNRIPTQLTVDRKFGLVAPHMFSSSQNTNAQAVAFGQQYLEPVIHGSFLSNEWQFGEEIYTKYMDNLPKTFHNFRYFTTQASIHMNHGNDLQATIEARPVNKTGPVTQIEGDIVEVRQQIIDPMEGSIMENAIDLETDHGVVSVGGTLSFIEDYEAISATLRQKKQ